MLTPRTTSAQTNAPAIEAPKGPPSATPSTDAGKTEPATVPTVKIERHASFDLTPEQTARFKKYLPRTLAKLQKRQPVHIAAIGDSIVDMYMYDEAAGDWLRGYPAAFARALSEQFYYTGGIRIIRPNPGKQSKDRPYMGPEITLRSLGRGGKLMIHAMQTLTSYGFENNPDLITVSFGINDANAALNLDTYAKHLQQVIDTVRAQGAELILLGSTLTVNDPPEADMAITRPYVDTMREVAGENGVFFVDLGDLASLVKVSEDATDPAQVFEQVVKQYRRFFDHGTTQDFVHPRPEVHRTLGKRILDELLNGPKPAPWTIASGPVEMKSSEEMVLNYNVRNDTKDPLTLTMLPLVPRAWKPKDALPQITLKPGKNKQLQVTYACTDKSGAGRFNPMPSHEPDLRLPILFSGGGMTRIEDLRAPIQPFAFLWKIDTQFNLEKQVKLETLVMNTSAQPLEGVWEASWAGQDLKGTLAIAKGAQQPVTLTFNLPDASSAPFRGKAPVTMSIKAAGRTLTYHRDLEVARNFGLKDSIPLSASDSDPASPAAGTADGKPRVNLKADADKTTLYLTYEISGIEFEDSPKQGAFGMDINLDARSYGKRLALGATEGIRLNGPAADGPLSVQNLQPWTFGTGYAAVFDPSQVKATLSSGASGVRRVNIAIPRTYLYMHEWALENGNSQIGINTAIQFWRGPHEGQPQGGYPDELSFSILRNRRHRNDAEGFAVLELTERHTTRWTAVLY